MKVENALTIAVLGRQPALGIAELESLYGAEHVQAFGEYVCMLDVKPEDIDFTRLGGSIKLCRVLTPLKSTKWRDIENYLLKTTPEHARYIDGKLSFGISTYGLAVSKKAVAAGALNVKKAIKQAGHSVRMVPHTDTSLGSATVLHNNLTGKNGWELVVISDGSTALLAQTMNVQDIDAYSARDQARPHRDAKVGMLPPKLAQIIINLAVGELEIDHQNAENAQLSSSQDPQSSICVLDPFCGTGVLLQEAMLMDYDILGTDIEPRMVQYAIDNLKWLDTKYPHVGDYRRIEIGDATTHNWEFSKLPLKSPRIVVAAESYLGKPLSTLPPGDQLSKIIYDTNLINHRFLQNIALQLKPRSRLCLALPAWRGKHEFLHLPLLDHLTDMGYTRTKLKHVSNEDLIYYRSNQVVARELVVLIKN